MSKPRLSGIETWNLFIVNLGLWLYILAFVSWPEEGIWFVPQLVLSITQSSKEPAYWSWRLPSTSCLCWRRWTWMKSPSAIPALPALEQSSWASGTGFCFPPRVLRLPLWSFTLEMELLGSPVSSVTLEKCAPSRGERVCVCARVRVLGGGSEK